MKNQQSDNVASCNECSGPDQSEQTLLDVIYNGDPPPESVKSVTVKARVIEVRYMTVTPLLWDDPEDWLLCDD